MITSDKSVLEPIKPIIVNLIGSGTGDGGSPLTTGTVAVTPDHQPNFITNIISPTVAITIRFLFLFGTILVGLLVAAMTPAGSKLLYTSDFLHLVYLCANLSLPGAGLGLIKDVVTVLGQLEKSHPLLTGSI